MISSQTTRSGWAAKARAIATCWRSPPESSPGKRSATRAGRRTRSTSLAASSWASRAESSRRTRAGRAIASPTRWRGLSESFGFWKTIWMRAPRFARPVGSPRGERYSVEDHASCAWRMEADDAPGDGRLAASGLPDDGEAFLARHREGNVPGRHDGVLATAMLGTEVLDEKKRRFQ